MNNVIDRVKTIAENNQRIYDTFATKEELSNYATSEMLEDYATRNDVHNNYATKEESKSYTDNRCDDIDARINTMQEGIASEYATKDYLAEVESIAKGSNQAVSFASYEEMQEELRGHSRGTLNVGQSIYIGTMNVPDVWVYGIPTNASQTEKTEADILRLFGEGQPVHIGYYLLAPLETLKVDLMDYATKEELGDIDTVLDSIIAIQNSLIGGDA